MVVMSDRVILTQNRYSFLLRRTGSMMTVMTPLRVNELYTAPVHVNE